MGVLEKFRRHQDRSPLGLADANGGDSAGSHETKVDNETPLALQQIYGERSFWDPEVRSVYPNIVKSFAKHYLLVAICMLGIFSIYWGSMMHKNDH